MDKIISEFKIVETDDGFRIEIKGDKELMRKMLSHRFDKKGRGPFGHHFPFGPGFFGGMGRWCGPWEEPEKEQAGT
ncbi:MAG: hypothetical protein JW850_20405 [Thermoflexales bacterium]|nr:hypothetical protein [Thermoflexales bacterium]